MPRSGGIYTLPPGYFAVDGTTIEVSQHNPPLEDIAQALTDSLPRDGSAPMTGNLAMGSNKITGLAAGTNPADAVRFDQLPTFTPTTGTLTAGTNAQGQGPITTDQVTITVAAANPSGATLPTAVAGKRVIIANRGANPVNIYPATGAAIGALATNAPVLLAVNQSVEFFARSATQWEGQISQPLDATLTSLEGLTLAAGDLLYATGADTLTRLPKGTAGQALVMNSGATAPEWGNSYRCRAWVNFNGAPASGTYSRTGTTVTVTMTAHDMTTGMIADLNFTTGTATDGSYSVTVLDANSFTVTDAASGTTSGNVTRNTFIRAMGNVASITDNGTGDYTINFTTAMSDTNYSFFGGVRSDATISGAYLTADPAGTKTTSSIQLRTNFITNAGAGGKVDAPEINASFFR